MGSVNKCLSFVVETGKEISKEEKSFGGLFCAESGSKENMKILFWEVLLQGRRNPALSAADLEQLVSCGHSPGPLAFWPKEK